MAKKFITAALPYVNNQPHLGNIVGSVLGADIYSRFCRKIGHEVVFICGTDEYGTATEMEAMKKGVKPIDIVTTNRVIHKAIYDWFGIEFDYFGNTTCQEHIKVVKDIFLQCYDNGYFEKQNVSQFYCEKCDQFLADRFVEGECMLCGFSDARGDQCDQCGKCLKSNELKNPKCSICGTLPALKNSLHLFLKLDALQDKIKEIIDHKIECWTENAKNIYKEWLNKELISRCMTRSLKYKWGVEVPLKGFEDKVFYVWFDAVLGYYTFLSIFKQNWQNWLEDAETIQFMGKDNVFFHAFILPGILLASGKNNYIVDKINSTEYLTFNGKKFSKSRNIGIFGLDLIKKDLGENCLWRYYLTKKRPETKDSDFCTKEFIDLYDADLRSNLGNLCQRVFKYINARLKGIVNLQIIDDQDANFVSEIDQVYQQYLDLMNSINLREAISKAFDISSKANKFIQNLQNNRSKLDSGFSLVYSAIILLGHVFYPFMPTTSKKNFKMANYNDPFIFPKHFEVIKSANISSEIEILFPQLTEKQINNLRSYDTE